MVHEQNADSMGRKRITVSGGDRIKWGKIEWKRKIRCRREKTRRSEAADDPMPVKSEMVVLG